MKKKKADYNINQYKLKNGEKRYKIPNAYIGVDTLTGKQVRATITGKTEKEVMTKYKKKVAEFEKNGHTFKKSTNIKTLNELIDLYLESYKPTVKEVTYNQVTYQIDMYIRPELGVYKVDKITTILIQNVVHKWDKGASQYIGRIGKKGNTKHYGKNLALLKKIFKYGISLGVLTKNPATDVMVPRKKTSGNIKEEKYLDKEEIQILFQAIDKRKFQSDRFKLLFKTYVHLLIYSGVRPSEGLALMWNDVDFKNSTININKTISSGKVDDTPKTDNSNRTILLDSITMNIMKRFKTYQQKECLKNGLKQKTFVFSKAMNDIPISYEVMKNNLNIVFREAKLPYSGLHILRHTHASLLINAGVEIKNISDRLGHKDITLTLNTYAHLFEETKTEDINKLIAYMST